MNEAIPTDSAASAAAETLNAFLGSVDPSSPQSLHILRDSTLKDIPTVARHGQNYQFHYNSERRRPAEATQDPCWRGYLPATISPMLLQYERRLAWRAGYQMGYTEAVDFSTVNGLWIPNRWYLPAFMELNSRIVSEKDGVEPWPQMVSRSVWAPSNDSHKDEANYTSGNNRPLEIDEKPDLVNLDSKEHIEAAVTWAKQLQKALVITDNELRNRARQDLPAATTAVNPIGSFDSDTQLSSNLPTKNRLSTIAEELEDRISSVKCLLPAIPELPVVPFVDFNYDNCIGKTIVDTSSEPSATEACQGSPSMDSRTPVLSNTNGGFSSPSPLNQNGMLPSELLNGASTPSTDEHGREGDSPKRVLFFAGRPCFTAFLTEKPKGLLSDAAVEPKRRQSSTTTTTSRSRNGPRKFRSEWRADLSSWRKP